MIFHICPRFSDIQHLVWTPVSLGISNLSPGHMRIRSLSAPSLILLSGLEPFVREPCRWFCTCRAKSVFFRKCPTYCSCKREVYLCRGSDVSQKYWVTIVYTLYSLQLLGEETVQGGFNDKYTSTIGVMVKDWGGLLAPLDVLKGCGASDSLQESSGPKSKPEIWVCYKTSSDIWQLLQVQVMKLQEKAISGKHQITWVFKRDNTSKGMTTWHSQNQ